MGKKLTTGAAVIFVSLFNLFIAGGCDFLIKQPTTIEKHADDTHENEKTEEAEENPSENENPAGEQEPAEIPDYSEVLKIWTGGDSITAAWQSYRCGIWEGMSGAGNEIDFVGTVHWDTNQFMRNPDEDHDGHSGYNVATWQEEFSDINNGNLAMMRAEKPDVLLLMLGTNDLAWWVANDDIAQTTCDSLMELVEQIFTWFPDISIIVATIPPMAEKIINSTGRDRAEYAAQYRTLLKAAVEHHSLFGSRLFLSDNYSVLTVDDLYDGIHPSEEGHDKMAQEWLRALAEYLETRTPE